MEFSNRHTNNNETPTRVPWLSVSFPHSNPKWGCTTCPWLIAMMIDAEKNRMKGKLRLIGLINN